ncbi:MAG: EamA family transporter [Oscillospiraceae bacterium]|nr:EamA family transporter [Oscillospiraceae bacterium]
MWFVYALICLLGWGFADLFYKKSADPGDRYSHLKVAVWVGLVMGVCALALLPFAEHGVGVLNLENLIKYAPASLAYIISMVIGYAGMRYLEISIISPVQNASGALSTVVMVAYFLFVGRMTSITEEFSALDILGTAVIVAGVIALAVVEHRLSKAERESAEKKYRFGALALLFPIAYCIFDTIGTAADGIILDEEVGLGLGDIDVLVLYGLTFLAAGVAAWLFLLLKTKKAYNPLTGHEIRTQGVAACFEEFGQVFYVFAMSRNPVVAAPMVASYCIVSVILSRIFLREKLTAAQYACVAAVIVGIVLLGVSEGLAEA